MIVSQQYPRLCLACNAQFPLSFLAGYTFGGKANSTIDLPWAPLPRYFRCLDISMLGDAFLGNCLIRQTFRIPI